MILYARTQSGPEKRVNEDSTLVINNVLNFGNYCKICDGVSFTCGIADGVGGQPGGDIASNFVLTALSDAYDNYYESIKEWNSGDICTFIKKMISNINDNLIDYASHLGEKQLMATTLSGIISINSKQYMFHVGNTRICSYKNNEILQLTKDHTTVNYLIEKGEITPKQAECLNKINEINGCIGAGDDKMLAQLEVSEVTQAFKDNNLIFMTTDGIHDFVPKEEIEIIFSETINYYGIDGLVSDYLITTEACNNAARIVADKTANVMDLIIKCLDTIAGKLIQRAREYGSKDDASTLILLQ